MITAFYAFKRHQLALPALFVPLLIMLIFSVFNLTAPPDSARTAAAFRLGIVNLDNGLLFPPMKVSNKVMEKLSKNLPFQIVTLATSKTARTALEAGNVAAVVLFAPDFSKNAVSDKDFSIEVWNAQHLTVAETQIAAQLPGMIQMAMSAGVANLRLALAKRRLPSGKFPVTVKVETVHKAPNSASLVAPFVMNFATWLAAFAGALLFYLATRQMGGSAKAAVNTMLPVVSLGIAALVLALVVASTTGEWGVFLPVWLNVWLVALCIGWLFLGLFSIFGLVAILLELPVVFYQNALGGTMAPLAAAPDWLRRFGEVIPFDNIGAAYRGIIHGADFALPIVWLAGAAIAGLVLIWGTAALRRAHA